VDAHTLLVLAQIRNFNALLGLCIYFGSFSGLPKGMESNSLVFWCFAFRSRGVREFNYLSFAAVHRPYRRWPGLHGSWVDFPRWMFRCRWWCCPLQNHLLLLHHHRPDFVPFQGRSFHFQLPTDRISPSDCCCHRSHRNPTWRTLYSPDLVANAIIVVCFRFSMEIRFTRNLIKVMQTQVDPISATIISILDFNRTNWSVLVVVRGI